MPIFKARYKGSCTKCSQAVEPGQLISWSRRQRGVMFHAECVSGSGSGAGETPTPTPPGLPDDAPAGSEERTGTDESEGEGSTPTPNGIDATGVRRIVRPMLHDAESRLSTYVDERATQTIAAVECKLRNTIQPVLTIKMDGPKPSEVKVEGGHHLLRDLLYVIAKRRHAYLYGPPGSGKSKAAAMAAEALGLEFGYVSLNPQTPESRLLGFVDAGGNYRPTVFRTRFEHGGIMCIDEMDNGHPALLNTINGMVEPGATLGAFPDGMVKRHADFILVSTGNTAGRGGDKQFPERRQFDAAFAERFVFIAWPYDNALEHALTMAQGLDKARAERWLSWVRGVRAYAEQHGLRLWATPRASMTGASFIADSGWDTAKVAEHVLFKGLDRDTVSRVLQACPLPAMSDDE